MFLSRIWRQTVIYANDRGRSVIGKLKQTGSTVRLVNNIIFLQHSFSCGPSTRFRVMAVPYETSRSDTPHSVGLLWTSDQPVAQTSTWQHTTLTRDRQPCHQRDENPQTQQTSGCRHTPQTAGPLGTGFINIPSAIMSPLSSVLCPHGVTAIQQASNPPWIVNILQRQSLRCISNSPSCYTLFSYKR